MTYINCQVIDNHTNRHRDTGIPGMGIRVILRSISHRDDTSVFTALTNSEGKVATWYGWKDQNFNLHQFLETLSEVYDSTWQLGFDVGNYFGIQNTCYQWIDVNFTMVHTDIYDLKLFVEPYNYRVHVSRWPTLENLLGESTNESGTNSVRDNVPTSPPKKLRWNLSKKQQLALKNHYVDDQYPNKETYQRLAESLDLEGSQLRKWFSTQRYKERSGIRKSKDNIVDIFEAHLSGLEHGDVNMDCHQQITHQISPKVPVNNKTRIEQAPLEGGKLVLRRSSHGESLSRATTVCGETSPEMVITASAHKVQTMSLGPMTHEIHTMSIHEAPHNADNDYDIHMDTDQAEHASRPWTSHSENQDNRNDVLDISPIVLLSPSSQADGGENTGRSNTVKGRGRRERAQAVASRRSTRNRK